MYQKFYVVYISWAGDKVLVISNTVHIKTLSCVPHYSWHQLYNEEYYNFWIYPFCKELISYIHYDQKQKKINILTRKTQIPCQLLHWECSFPSCSISVQKLVLCAGPGWTLTARQSSKFLHNHRKIQLPKVFHHT